MTQLDDNSFKWESVNREIDGELATERRSGARGAEIGSITSRRHVRFN